MPRRTTAAPPAEPAEQHPGERAEVRALLAETQALSARLAALNEVAVALQASLDLESALAAMAREARWVLDFQYCSVAERLEDSYLERVLRSPDPASPATRGAALDSGPIGRAMRAEHALLLRSEEEVGGAAPGMRSGLIVPLRGQGRVIGTLNFFAEQPDHYTISDMRVVSAMAAQTAMALLNTRLFREVGAARDLLHTTLESIEDGVLVLDDAGRVRLANSAARRMLHLGGVPVAGARLVWLAARARAGARRLVPRGALRAAARALPQSGGRLDLGDGHHVEWAAARLRADASPHGLVVTLRDISDRVALEELRDDMIGMLVHDLRTPLTSLIMSLDMLQLLKSMPPAPEDDDLLDRAGESARQLLRQVNTLLDMRKLEAGRLELDVAPHDVGELLEPAQRRFETLARFSGVRLELGACPGLPPVSADPDLVGRALDNLLGNALKFTPRGGSVTLGARALDGGRAVELSVADTGTGVPPALRHLLFEKYGQAHREAGQRRGTGLGLAFCRLAVEAHGGQAGLRDNPGGGSVFWLTLPVVYDSARS